MWQVDDRSEAWLNNEGKAHIRDLAVIADWDPLSGVGGLDIRMAIGDNRDSGDDRLFVRALVGTPDGEFLTTGASRLIAEVPFTAPRTWCPVRLCRQIPRPMFWSADASQCYSLLLILEDSRGQVVDVVAGRFGVAKPVVRDMMSRAGWACREIPSSDLLYA